MDDIRLTYLVDPDCPGTLPPEIQEGAGEIVHLIEEDGEYVTAVSRTADLPAYRSLPDEVVLDLYCYELLERMRERQNVRNPDSPVETWVIPLWPACVYAAAGCAVHSGREIVAGYPRPDRVGLVVRDGQALLREARRLLGRHLMDPDVYTRLAVEAAGEGGWQVFGTGEGGSP